MLEKKNIRKISPNYIIIYIYIYMCVCVCVCVFKLSSNSIINIIFLFRSQVRQVTSLGLIIAFEVLSALELKTSSQFCP